MGMRFGLAFLGVLLCPAVVTAQHIRVDYPNRSGIYIAGGPLTVRWTNFGNVPNKVEIVLTWGDRSGMLVLSAEELNLRHATVTLPLLQESIFCQIVVAALPDKIIAGWSEKFRIVPQATGGPPDLVGCLYWDGKRPYIQEHKTLTARVLNVGSGTSAPSSFDIYQEGFGTHRVAVPSLVVGRHFDLRKRLSWATAGHKTIRLTVDPDNQIAEKNEANNQVEARVSVILPGQDRYVGETQVCSDQQ